MVVDGGMVSLSKQKHLSGMTLCRSNDRQRPFFCSPTLVVTLSPCGEILLSTPLIEFKGAADELHAETKQGDSRNFCLFTGSGARFFFGISHANELT
jgi:hypothetical protein